MPDWSNLLGDVLQGAAGNTTPTQADQLGMPQANGLNPAQLQDLMMMPERQAQTQALQEQTATAPIRQDLLKAQAALARSKTTDSKKGLIDKMSVPALKAIMDDYDKQYTGKNAIINSMDPAWEQNHEDATANYKLAAKRLAEIAGVKPPPEPKKAKPETADGAKGKSDTVKVTSSRGKQHVIKRSDLAKAKELDPGMKIVGE